MAQVFSRASRPNIVHCLPVRLFSQPLRKGQQKPINDTACVHLGAFFCHQAGMCQQLRSLAPGRSASKQLERVHFHDDSEPQSGYLNANERSHWSLFGCLAYRLSLVLIPVNRRSIRQKTDRLDHRYCQVNTLVPAALFVLKPFVDEHQLFHGHLSPSFGSKGRSGPFLGLSPPQGPCCDRIA